MKIHRILVNSLLASTLVVSQSLLLSSRDQAKAQSTRPYIVLVNGWQNCCAWGIADRLPQINAEIRFVPYSNFVDGGRSGNTSTDEQFLRDGADFINNKLDRNRPLILIGHSFGGDSVLKLLPSINRRIQFVAVIDPVSTGGFRNPLTRSLAVGNNVEYFFNRWQENVPFPNDFGINGSIPCNARICDQDSQNIARNADFSPVTTECGWDEVTCPGFLAPNPLIGRSGRKGRKQVRVSHQGLPKDAFIQKELGNKIQRKLVGFRPSSPDSFALGFYKEPNRPEVYLVFRSNGRHCHVQNPDQMNAFGGFGKVQSVSSLTFTSGAGEFSGGCGWPNGFFKLSGKPEVYKLFGPGIPEFNIGDRFCHVVNPAQMNAFGGFGQVRDIATGSDLGRGRTFIGGCPNP